MEIMKVDSKVSFSDRKKRLIAKAQLDREVELRIELRLLGIGGRRWE